MKFYRYRDIGFIYITSSRVSSKEEEKKSDFISSSDTPYPEAARLHRSILIVSRGNCTIHSFIHCFAV